MNMNTDSFPIALPSIIISEKLEVLDSNRDIRLEIKYREDLKVYKDFIIFRNVIAFKTTYLYALTFKETEKAMIDGIVKLERSDWLDSVSDQITLYNRKPKDYSHFKVYFDKGPLYDFLCTNVEFELNNLVS
jgi:hypothetical protein